MYSSCATGLVWAAASWCQQDWKHDLAIVSLGWLQELLACFLFKMNPKWSDSPVTQNGHSSWVKWFQITPTCRCSGNWFSICQPRKRKKKKSMTKPAKLFENVKKWKRKQSKRQQTRMWLQWLIEICLLIVDRLTHWGQCGWNGRWDCWQRTRDGLETETDRQRETYMWTRMALLSRRSRLSLWTLNVTREEMFAY